MRGVFWTVFLGLFCSFLGCMTSLHGTSVALYEMAGLGIGVSLDVLFRWIARRRDRRIGAEGKSMSDAEERLALTFCRCLAVAVCGFLGSLAFMDNNEPSVFMLLSQFAGNWVGSHLRFPKPNYRRSKS